VSTSSSFLVVSGFSLGKFESVFKFPCTRVKQPSLGSINKKAKIPMKPNAVRKQI
jgi:hypothetical protein